MPAHPMSGPIPGENYTSDTKNYPWHRPPEVTDLDQAVELASKQLLDESNSLGLVTMLKAGIDIATLTDTFVTSGIGAGKWTPDFAILLAGPVSHIIYLMAKGYGIDADLGIDLPKMTKTISYLNAAQGDQKKIQDAMDAMDDPEVVSQIEDHIRGLMGAAQMRPPLEPQSQGIGSQTQPQGVK